MPWARASSLARHLACPAASWLPRADRGSWHQGYLTKGDLVAPAIAPPDQDMSFADWGTELHNAKAGHGEDPWSSLIEPHREQLWPAGSGQHEVCVAYNCRSRVATIGPADLSKSEQDAWKAAQNDDCVVGVADWAGWLPDELPWVDDLKTGWKRPDPEMVQLQFYLLVWAKSRGDKQGWTSVTWWPRGSDTTPSRQGLWRKHTVVAFDELEDQLHRAWLAATGLNHEPRPGIHCSYCPSASVCSRAYE